MTRSRLFFAGAALAAFFVVGFAVAWSQTGEPTVETQTFTNVVTYTVPTVTETTVSTETVTTTVTVTAPTTTTAPPPTTTEPEPEPEGTTIGVASGTFVCNQSVQSLATDGMPLTVNTLIPNGSDGLNGDVRLLAGCTAGTAAGDGVCDLVLHINGNGGGFGSGDDGLVLIRAHDIDICGYVDCGQPLGGAHQDGVQMNYGYRLTFLGFESGDWDAQRPTCHGAGGIFYVSQLNDVDADLVDVVCDGCRMVGSTAGNFGTALHLGASTRSGARGSCFSARIPLGRSASPVDPVNDGNLFIDRDSAEPQPSPTECAA